MAGEIQIGGTTFATESGGAVTIANVDSATNRTNLGLGSIATQASGSIDIDGGAIDGTTIGGTSAAAGTFTTFTSTGIDDNASTTALTIDSSGNVGIGTSSSSSFNQRVTAPHLVVGSGSNNSGVTVYSGTANQGSINFADGTTTTQQYEGGLVYNHPSNYMSFHTNGGAERMRIDDNGKIKINTGSTTGILNVDNANNEPVIYAVSSATLNTANPGIIIQKQDNDNTTAQTYLSFNHNAGLSGAGGIQGNGSSGIQFYSSSDIRLKENILDLSSELPNILSLQPRTFDFIDGPTDCVGFIADEVELIYPEMVSVNEIDGYKTLGGISTFDTRLVKAIQEQQALIETQQSQIDALTARIEALEATP